jgi:tetratricopeptide (TPR) repeat protein
MDSIDPDEIAYTRPAAAQLESVSGDLQFKGGKHEAAAGHFQRAIELLLPRQHADSPHLAAARADLALALAAQGRRAQAQALADQARAAFATHPAVAPHFRRSLIAVDKLLKRT